MTFSIFDPALDTDPGDPIYIPVMRGLQSWAGYLGRDREIQ